MKSIQYIQALSDAVQAAYPHTLLVANAWEANAELPNMPDQTGSIVLVVSPNAPYTFNASTGIESHRVPVMALVRLEQVDTPGRDIDPSSACDALLYALINQALLPPTALNTLPTIPNIIAGSLELVVNGQVQGVYDDNFGGPDAVISFQRNQWC